MEELRMEEQVEKKAEVTLTEEEKNMIRAHQELIDRERMTLANLRMQYLASERQVMANMEKAQNDFVSHLKVLSKAKGIPANEEWIFDAATFSFRPRP